MAIHETTERSAGTLSIDRRGFLRGGALVLGGLVGPMGRWCAAEAEVEPELCIALMTDMHSADKPPHGVRFYRQAREKLLHAVDQFNRRPPDFAIQLGDFIDGSSDQQQSINALRSITEVYAKLRCERHHVLGNHDLAAFSKRQFLSLCSGREPYYSFDVGRYHVVILDACYRRDGTSYSRGNYKWTDTAVPAAELAWLEKDINRESRPTLIFIHQRIDLDSAEHYAVKNAPAVRRVLEASGCVLAVFQGHNHRNAHRKIGGIHYCTLEAMVDGSGSAENAYAALNLYEDGSIRVEGFYQQDDYAWSQ